MLSKPLRVYENQFFFCSPEQPQLTPTGCACVSEGAALLSLGHRERNPVCKWKKNSRCQVGVFFV